MGHREQSKNEGHENDQYRQEKHAAFAQRNHEMYFLSPLCVLAGQEATFLLKLYLARGGKGGQFVRSYEGRAVLISESGISV